VPASFGLPNDQKTDFEQAQVNLTHTNKNMITDVNSKIQEYQKVIESFMD
jgi:hypothetical protein